MGLDILLAYRSGLFNLWRARLASKVSSSVSEEELLEEELLGVVRSFITLSWLGLFGRGTAGFFASPSSFWTTISKAVLSLEWLGLVGRDLTRGCLGVELLASFLVGLDSLKVQVLVETQNCFCWP